MQQRLVRLPAKLLRDRVLRHRDLRVVHELLVHLVQQLKILLPVYQHRKKFAKREFPGIFLRRLVLGGVHVLPQLLEPVGGRSQDRALHLGEDLLFRLAGGKPHHPLLGGIKQRLNDHIALQRIVLQLETGRPLFRVGRDMVADRLLDKRLELGVEVGRGDGHDLLVQHGKDVLADAGDDGSSRRAVIVLGHYGLLKHAKGLLERFQVWRGGVLRLPVLRRLYQFLNPPVQLRNVVGRRGFLNRQVPHAFLDGVEGLQHFRI